LRWALHQSLAQAELSLKDPIPGVKSVLLLDEERYNGAVCASRLCNQQTGYSHGCQFEQETPTAERYQANKGRGCDAIDQDK
jgi:hypothetical protein